MTFLVVASAMIVVMLGIILFAVYKTRPRSLRFKASVTRLMTLSLEIEAPQQTTEKHAANRRRKVIEGR
jgi:hypothetical protein